MENFVFCAVLVAVELWLTDFSPVTRFIQNPVNLKRKFEKLDQDSKCAGESFSLTSIKLFLLQLAIMISAKIRKKIIELKFRFHKKQRTMGKIEYQFLVISQQNHGDIHDRIDKDFILWGRLGRRLYFRAVLRFF